MTDKLYIFFDTETTGVPRDYKAPTTDTRNWPRLVQLGWILMDSEGNKLSQKDHIIRPEGFTIPADASRIHGITTERALKEGRELTAVIEEFMADFDTATFIVGHNVDFDKKFDTTNKIAMCDRYLPLSSRRELSPSYRKSQV